MEDVTVTLHELGEGDDELVLGAGELFDTAPSAAWTARFLTAPGHHLILAADAAGGPVGFVTGVEMTHPDKGTEMFLYELGVRRPADATWVAARSSIWRRSPAARAATACGRSPSTTTRPHWPPTARRVPSPSPARRPWSGTGAAGCPDCPRLLFVDRTSRLTAVARSCRESDVWSPPLRRPERPRSELSIPPRVTLSERLPRLCPDARPCPHDRDSTPLPTGRRRRGLQPKRPRGPPCHAVPRGTATWI